MIVTADEIATALARDFSAAETAAVEDLLQSLEDDLRTYLKRPLTPEVVVDEDVTAIYRDGKVRLKKTPVLSVQGVTIGGTPIETWSYMVRPWGLDDVSAIFGPSSLILPAPQLLVSYTGGLPGDDPDSDFGRAVRSKIKAAAKRAVTQEIIEKAVGVDRLSVEGTSISFVNGKGGWMDSELAALSGYRRRIVRT